ncbi:ATP-binding protein [Amycolatopsis sp. NPDC004772]
MTAPSKFFSRLQHQESPLAALNSFLDREQKYEQAQQVELMRFVGYVLEVGYDGATIITSDPFKRAVGGIPRGSFLILAPDDLEDLPPHFTLLRVMETAPTPLSQQVQQTYFELHKKSMPELDVWTQSELQWGALRCAVLGMFHPDVDDRSKVQFAGDVNNVVSAHRYKVYAPDAELLDIIVNGLVDAEGDETFELGDLRLTESRLADLIDSANAKKLEPTPVRVSIDKFKGARTAMFGKTRLGKSNVVKLIAQGIIDSTAGDRSVGQLIFDINGEYANDNEQDGSRSIRSANEDVCSVYALTERPGTPSKRLRFNFYEQPDSCIEVLASLLEEDRQTSIYIRSFAQVALPSIASIKELDHGAKTRQIRKIQYYWAILHEAGFASDESRLRKLELRSPNAADFNPNFNQKVRAAVYGAAKQAVPEKQPFNLHTLVSELKLVAAFVHKKGDDPVLVSTSSGEPLFDSDDLAMLKFLNPSSGAGPSVLRTYAKYHSPHANDLVNEIVRELDNGQTVILDLGNATDKVRRYFSDALSKGVFRRQEEKFTGQNLGGHFVQLYFEEAHNLFPLDDKDITGVYARFAKEGAKFHIGMVYSTQSPSTINRELLTQTENFFIGHLSSEYEVKALSRLQRAFSGVEEEIMRSRTPGYMRILTRSHRFVVPVQARKFEARQGD